MSIFSILLSIIEVIITLIICFIIGSFLPGIERKFVHARIQQRIGPPVTVPGIIAPIKFLYKKHLEPNSPAPNVYKALPLVSLITVLLILVFLTPELYSVHILSSIIAIIGLLKVEEITYVFMGSLSKSVMSLSLKFPDTIKGSVHPNVIKSHIEDLSSKRSLRMITYGSFPLYLALFIPIVSCGSLNIFDIIQYQQINGPFLFTTAGILGAISFFIGSLILLNECPFSIIEAESDVIQGPYMEYSAAYRSVIYWAKGSLMFTLSALFIIFFIGIPLNVFSISILAYIAIPLIYTIIVGIFSAFTPIFINRQLYPTIFSATLIGVIGICISILL